MSGPFCVALGIALWLPAIEGCKGPAPPSPAELARAAASAGAAAELAASTAESAAAPAPPPPPVPILQTFNAQVPTGLCAPAEAKSCALDSAGGAPATDLVVVKAEQETMLVGWAGDADTATVPSVILLQLTATDPKAKKGAGKKFFAPAQRITKRPDVADALKQPALVDAGYDLLASFKEIEKGEYAVSVVQVNSVGNALLCDTRRKLKVE